MKKIVMLRKKEEFSHLFRYGKRVETPLFTLFIKQNNVGFLRLGVVVSKSVDKRAVIRNTLRRRIKEWVRKLTPPPIHAKDIVFLLKKEVVIAPRKKIYEELNAIKEKI